MKKNVLLSILICVLFLTATIYILRTSTLVRFWADDFCSSVLLRNNGFWNSQIIWWNGWTGRYSYVAFLDFVALFGLTGAQVLPIVLYAFFTLSLVLIFIFNPYIALLLSVTFLINSPNIIQSFYWMTGSLNYFIPFIFLNFYLSLFFLKYKSFFPLLGFILLFIATGFSEAFGIANLIFLSLLLFVFYKKGKNIILMYGLAATLISLFLMYLSPGNSVRSATVSHPDGFFDLLTKTFYYSKWYLIHLLYIKPFTISMRIIVFAAFCFLDDQYKYFEKPKQIIVLATAFIAIVTFAVVGLTYQAMNWEPPERVMTIVNYMIIFAMLILSTALVQLFGKYIPKKLAVVILCILIVISCFSIDYHWSTIYQELKVSADSPIYLPVGKLDGLSDNNGWVASCIMDYYK